MRVPSRHPRFASAMPGLQCGDVRRACSAQIPSQQRLPGSQCTERMTVLASCPRARRIRIPCGTNPDRRPKMLKTLMISAAISALMVSGALAQADMSPKPPAAKNDAATAAPHDTAKFIAAQSTDQWGFSKFKGTDVLGPDNAHSGNGSDMLFDKNGKILGLIVGVGEFLGIGEKSVAIDMSAFQPVPADTGSSSTGAGGNTTMASRNDDPTMVKLKVSWTKDQLKNAPDFQNYKQPARTTSAAGGSRTHRTG